MEEPEFKGTYIPNRPSDSVPPVFSERNSNYCVFPAEDEKYLDFFPPGVSEKSKRYTPSQSDISRVMILLGNFLLEKEKMFLRLRDYKIQFFAYLNENSEKIIWANFFYDKDNEFAGWKKDLVFVLDGGNAFFNLKINLTYEPEKVYDLRINGEA